MKAIGYARNLPIDDKNSLQDIIIEIPNIQQNDLLIEVKAVSVNPVDTKLRLSSPVTDGSCRILGFDGAGIVAQIGDKTKGFKLGDEVYYAGVTNRQGSNSQFQAIDYRIVAHKPKNIDFKTAVSLPLTSLTAYEMLFDRLKIQEPVVKGKNALLMIGGAGGVGSIAIQLIRKLTDIDVIATASHQESRDWALKMGAHHVVDHSKDLLQQLKTLGYDQVSYIFSTANSSGYLAQFSQCLTPQGRLGMIDSPTEFDIMALKTKSISVHWEYMFTRPFYETEDIARQSEILTKIAQMVDEQSIIPTLNKVLSPINAANLRLAHEMTEKTRNVGKIVLEGFE